MHDQTRAIVGATLSTMDLSQTLLLIAALSALLPVLSIGPKPPSTTRDIEKIFVVGFLCVGIGGFAVYQLHGFDFFAFVHLLYLFAVVTVPALLTSWYLLSIIRRRRTRLLNLGAGLATLLALIGVWGTHIEPNWLQTDVVALETSIAVPMTIGVLADLQTPNVGKHEWNAVNTLIEADPDLVLIPGDFFQGPPAQIAAETPNFVALLEAIRGAGIAVLIVSGDSDFNGQLIPMADAGGATYIDNQIIDLVIGDQPVRVAGVSVGPDGGARLSTLAALLQPTDGFTILLSHRPDAVFDLPAGADVDLIVAGHTHGGQISLPFYGPPVTFSDVPRSLAAGGLEIVNGYPVYVSAGVGLERFGAPQVRFGVRPEVGIIELVPTS